MASSDTREGLMLERLAGIVRGGYEHLQTTFSGGFLSNLKKGNLLIPEKAIEEGLRAKLASDDIEVLSLQCLSDSIAVEITKRKLGANLHYKARIEITTLMIDSEHHEAVLEFKNDKLAGEKLWGKVVATLVNLLIKDIIAGTLSVTDVEEHIQYDASTRRAQIDLNAIPAVRRLYEQKKVLMNRRAIDFAYVSNCTHVDKGLLLHTGSSLGHVHNSSGEVEDTDD